MDLEEKISDLERHFALEKRSHQDQKERAAHIKQEFQDLSEEYINLKGNFTSLTEDHQSLVSLKNLNFSLDLINQDILYPMLIK